MSDPVLEFIASNPKVTIRKLANWCHENDVRLNLLSRDQSLAFDTPLEILSQQGCIFVFTFEDLLQNGIIDPNEIDDTGRSLISTVAEQGKLDYVKLLLLHQAKIERNILQVATKQVKDFLNYRPGHRQQSIFDYCCLNYKYNIDHLEALIYDEDNTTSAESSGDELHGIQDPWEKKQYQAYNATRNTTIQRYEEHRSTHLIDNPIDPELAFVTYRGVHFVPKHYDHDRKVAIRANKNTTGRPTVSYATLKEAGYETDDELTITPKLTQAVQKTNGLFHKLRQTSDKKEKKKPTRNDLHFPNLFYRFVQAYVMDYKYLFNDGAVSKVFGASDNSNPAISTSYIAEKAMSYGMGIRFPDDSRLSPHYRRSTQKPKHPYLGFTDCYVIDLNYFRQHGHYVLELMQKKLINISHVFQFECEVLFESIIPGQYHYYRDIFRMPDFSQPWSQAMEAEFGYHKGLWTRHKNEIARITSPKVASDLFNKIIEQVIQYRATILTKNIEHRLNQGTLPRYPIIPHTEGHIVASPDDISPNDKTKWVRIDGEDTSDLTSAFGNLGFDPKAKKVLFPEYPTAQAKNVERVYHIPLWTLDHEIPDQVIHDIELGVLNIGRAITINGHYLRLVDTLDTSKGKMLGIPGMTKKVGQVWLIRAIRGG